MKINFLEENGDRLKNSKSRKYEKLFLKILEDDEYFTDKVIKARKILKIPTLGLTKPTKITNFKKAVQDHRKQHFTVATYQIVDNAGAIIADTAIEYNLGFDWWEYFWMIVNYNTVMFNPKKPVFYRIIKGKEITKKEKNIYIPPTEDRVFIEILDPKSLGEFTKWIKSKWSELTKISSFNKGVSRFTKTIKAKNIDAYKIIFDLRERKKYKFSQIANYLSEKNIGDFTDDNIRVMLDRYKKIIRDLRK